ncbi:MAG: helix-turn-helix domain-containing protein [Halioglobus sp.]
MSQVGGLLKTLKRELKANGITYAEVAMRLAISESSVKRMFSEGRLSLDRLEALCQITGMEIADLVQKMESERKRIEMLTEDQEQEVASNPMLLLVAICVLNQWTYEEILDTYTISEHECIQLLAQLDRLRLISLEPLNRFRLCVASDFRWIPGGPIQQYFRKHVQPAFMNCGFSGPGEKFEFRSGMLSRASNAALVKKIDRLVAEFNELHGEDMVLPLEDRYGSSLLVAFRPWEFDFFRELRRKDKSKRF